MEFTNISDYEMARRLVLICAFNALEEKRSPLPSDVEKRHKQVVWDLEAWGYLTCLQGRYWLNQAGVAHWRQIVNDHYKRYNHSLPRVVKLYNEDGTRKGTA